MRRTSLLPVLAAVLALSACDSGADKSGPETRWTLRVEPGTTVPLATSVAGVVLDGNTALFPFTDRATGRADLLGSVDLTNGKRQVLARSAFQGGSILGAVRTGNEVVYLDESSRGDRDPGAARWRVIALGSHRVLASSGDRRVTMSPDLTTIAGTAVWTVYPDQGGSEPRAFGWKPGGQVERRDAPLGDEVECTPPAVDPELVGGCDRRDGWVAWVQRSAPDDGTDPGALFYARADGGSPRRIGSVLADGAGPVIFGDYLLWQGTSGFMVTSLLHPSVAVRVLASSPDRSVSLYGSDGDRAAIVTKGNATTTLRVIRAASLRLSSSTD